MGKGKAADKKGVTLEMFLHGSDLLIEMVADLFTRIMQPCGSTPSSWKESWIKVIFKKGDSKLPENWIPGGAKRAPKSIKK